MRLSEGIYLIRDVLTVDECASLIERTEALGYSAAPIIGGGGEEKISPLIRNNKRVMMDDPDLASLLWSRISAEVPAILIGRQVVGVNERFRFYRYTAGQHFSPHVDGSFSRQNGEKSLLTFMVYLNDDCKGGETNFNETRVRPIRGMALIFKHELFHEGAEVKSGKKYVLRSDVMYGPVGRLAG
jgi:predicted 2-oxoglutarate/Fe(II)-dependent dioxygenase YbiX